MFSKFHININNNNEGFTLIEALIYIGVLSIMMLVIASFFLWIKKADTKAMVMEETLNNANKVMELIVYEIKTSQEIYQPTSVFASDKIGRASCRERV